jgi:DNA sulfur modification protein DndB
MTQLDRLLIPALRAYMGDWVYYIGAMKLSDVAARISFAGQIHQSAALRELIQRTLDESKHASQISAYLLRDRQRLFSSLVVGVYGGTPEWHEVKIRHVESLDPSLTNLDKSGVLGFLSLSGSEKLFALDGQHRVAGIKHAVAGNTNLGNEEVSIIFVSHRSTPDGLQRTRRLFTRLNRFAKPVRKEEIIALDEDDSVAILTRRFVDEEKDWRDKVSLHKTKAMPVTDQKSITTIGAIYDVLDSYLGATRDGWTEFKRMRPKDRELDAMMAEAKGLWRALAEAFPSFSKALKKADPTSVIAQARGPHGGEIFFRPIGLETIVRTIVNFRRNGVSLSRAVNQISKVRMDLAGPPWAGVFWNSAKSRMLSGSENKKVAQTLLYWLSGGNLSQIKSSEEQLRVELEGVLNKPAGSLDLAAFKQSAMR